MSFPPPQSRDDAVDEVEDFADHPDETEDEVIPGPTCAFCRRTLADTFYRVNEFVACESCRDLIEGVARSGSGLGRFLKATVLGGGAAVLAAVAFFWSSRYLHFSPPIAMVPIGFVIAAAVRKGMGGRGGLVYQLMTVGLIYASLGLTCTAIMVGKLADRGMLQAGADDDLEDDAPGPIAAAPAPPGAPLPAPAPAPPPRASLRNLLAALSFLGIGLAYLVARLPLGYIQGSPTLGVFLVLAMAGTWKLNRRERVRITGPFPTDEIDPAPGQPGPTPALA